MPFAPKMSKARLDRKRQKVAGRLALIAKARARVILTSDNIRSELLAATSRIALAIRAYSKSAKPGRDDQAITDILVDLRHFCDSKGLVFDDLNAAAVEHYWDQKADLV
jgi:hypothetical protein